MWNRKGRRDEASHLVNGCGGEFGVVVVEYEF